MSGCRRVFVYGSLMEGLQHGNLLEDALSLDRALRVEGFALLDLGPYPGALATGHGALMGELYEVDVPTLRRLDALEGHPDLFRRRLCDLSCGGQAWLYELVPEAWAPELLKSATRVAHGDWRAHLSRRSASI